MRGLLLFVKRNMKMFFRDKGMFFTSLITPMILLVLYVTFLGSVFEDSFLSVFEENKIKVSSNLLRGLVAGELVSSLLAVSCVTVAFCSNFLMVQDKVTGAKKDFLITPVKSASLAGGYYIASILATLIVCYMGAAVCFLYVAYAGWYLSVTDVLAILLDEFILVLFGTGLSSVINFFLSTQGQISAVGTIVSAGYGFLCGAYMPISSFSNGLQKMMSYLPGTYGTSLLRNHTMQGVFAEMSHQKVSDEIITGLKDSVDCHIYFNGKLVGEEKMYTYLILIVIVLICFYVYLNKKSITSKQTGK